MLTSVEGIYENGRVYLLEPLPEVTRARVVVTVLPETRLGASSVSADDQASAALVLSQTGRVDEDASEISELGQLLLKVRQRALDQGMPQSSVDAIMDEIVRGRRAESGK
ncbi:hypothetical protein [Rhabdochromatium marinum]|uniref:hypothetical protein n=1 Tax=Rhabdochromatium marinum TaxID=48729 RepID=UPI00190781DC|nr:hypothetical protein [Rhabdochromatium marinum]MBK1648380.1 hypothetical protein [Rhabdochromatium marinum]